MKQFALGLVGLACVAGAAHADIITVTATGEVFFNRINDGQLGNVNSGEIATVTFTVDSDTFVEDIPGDVRAYAINHASFTLSFSGGASVGLSANSTTPNFGVIDGFPVSDGFFVSEHTSSPGGVQLSQEPYNFDLSLGYVGETLDSLDILDALGTYDFDGLTRYSMNVWNISPDNVVLGMDFSQMTITPAPASVALLGLGGLVANRRRR
ncbi:MAG: PEP-CTERM sorting domain-containing protein [Phycisphaerales bacterium JB054]